VSREVRANGGAGGYKPLAAHKTARIRARRPKPAKLLLNDQLRDCVAADLER
jgi:IS30 family transposase